MNRSENQESKGEKTPDATFKEQDDSTMKPDSTAPKDPESKNE